MKSGKADYGKVAQQFASALSKRDFETASQLLTSTLRKDLTAVKLATKYERMVKKYRDGFQEASNIELTTTMEDWPAKQKGDAGWAYVSIDGKFARGAWCEAVTVIVADTKEGLRIRHVEWGRP